jgi:hypothetical protein
MRVLEHSDKMHKILKNRENYKIEKMRKFMC